LTAEPVVANRLVLSVGIFFIYICSDSAPGLEQVSKERTLAIPHGLMGNISQLTLGDQTGMAVGQKQNIFLNVGRKLGQVYDLGNAGGRNMRELCQFRVIVHLSGANSRFEPVR
jgi:hypothetical protein